MKKITFITLFFILIITGSAQSVSPGDLNEQVRGIFFYGNSSFLVTPRGFIQLPDQEINKQYSEYYKKVYGDSTIVNPNTVLQTDDSEIFQYIVPFVNVSEMGKDFINFSNDYNLNDFMSVDSSGKMVYQQGLSTIIGNIINQQKGKK